MTKTIQALHQEHLNMTKMLDAFERQLSAFDAAGSPDYDIIQGSVDYCLDYLDLYHHPKEVLVLRKLQSRDPTAAAAVGNLEAEHKKLAELANRVRAAIEQVLRDAGMSRQSFDRTARGFLESYRSHIETEERLHFPAVVASLSPQDWFDIENHLTSLEDPAFGKKIWKRFEALHRNIVAWDRSDQESRR
ncbi:MAG: hypothetical protein QOK29_3855 [Rhodospirillaceae bacterium]|jgi:hemerythrin-like domain-containing protein|nr:hypothetical protein [Rhodospirillaceae bacterium]